MMLYSIKDLKGTFSAVFSFANDDVAKRNLVFIIEGNQLYQRYPEDFALYRVGSFEFESGIIEALPTPLFVCNLPTGKEE